MKKSRYSEAKIVAVTQSAPHPCEIHPFFPPLCQGSCPLLYFSLFLRWAG